MPKRVTSQLDDIDHRLIGELFADGRATYAALAPKVGLSQAAVRARVRRLLDEHVVTVTARVDPRSLEQDVFAFVFATTDRAARGVAAEIAAIDEAVFVVCLTGRWGLMAEIRCRDNRHLLETLDRLRSIEGVAGLESVSAVEYRKMSTSGIAAEVFGRQADTRHAVPAAEARPMDDVDRRLVRALAADGRATYADLAPGAGLSQAGVRARVQRLLDDGIVVIQASAGAQVLGLASFSAVLVSVRGEIGPVAEALCAMPEFTIVAACNGRYDLAGEVWSRDRAHLLDVVDSVRDLPGAMLVETATYLEIVKEQYRIG